MGEREDRNTDRSRERENERQGGREKKSKRRTGVGEKYGNTDRSGGERE